MNKVRLLIAGLQYSQTQTGAYALILEEESGNRRLPIIIGSNEAQAIAIELENMRTTRPLTHDLFFTFAREFNIGMEEAVVYDFKEGVFYGKIVCTDGAKIMEIDCRPSDAVALAVRFQCPIYTHEFIMEAAGFVRDSDGESAIQTIEEHTIEHDDPMRSLHARGDDELEKMMQEAIENEDYEMAGHIRDELNRRKGN